MITFAAPWAAALAALGPVQDSKPAVDAAAVLAAYESKRGAADARAKIRTLRLKGAVAFAGFDSKGTVEELFAPNDRFKWSYTWGGAYGSTMGSTGTYSWSTDPAMGITIREPKDALGFTRLGAFCIGAPWTSLYGAAEVTKKKDHSGRPHWILKMTGKNGTSDTWWIDADASTVSRIDTQLPDPMGGSIPMTFEFSEWKPVDGLLIAHARTQKAGGIALSYNYSEVQVNGAVSDEEVAPSKDVEAAWKDPSRRSKQAPEKSGVCATEKTQEQFAFTIRAKIAKQDVSKHLAVVLPEVGAAVARAGAATAGPPFSRYYSMGDEVDIEAGVPIKAKKEASGRVQCTTLPGATCAATWHIGPYQSLGSTYAILEKWIQDNKLSSDGAPWEIYWTDPGLEPDPTKWRTQIFWPVK